MTGRELLRELQARDRGPAVRLLGHDLVACDPEAQRVRVAYEARPEFCNPMGQVQGGILSTMLEQAMVDAAYCAAGPDAGAVTLELETQFLISGRPGPILAEAWVSRLGRSIAFLAGELQDGDGKRLLTGSAVVLLQTRAGTGG